jgi:imidazolonepropionase-like amidohydrolase
MNASHATDLWPLFLAALLAALLLAGTPGGAQAPERGEATVLRGARLIDGAGGPPVENAAMVIRDGHITAIGPADSVSTPTGADVINYGGKTIIPGLISNHSHVGVIEGIKAAAEHYNRANIMRQLRQYEAYGVTTVTSLGLNGPVFYELRADVHAGRIPGADLFGSDRGVGVPNGAPPAQMLPVGADQLYRPETPELARQAVREMAARKTDLIKLWLDDFNGSLPVKMRPEIYQAVIDEAHQNGLRVAAHIHDFEDAKAIVSAGADILAHGMRDQPVDTGFIQMLKARSVWYIPTLALDEATFVYAEQPDLMRDPFVLPGVQPALRAQTEDSAWRASTLASPSSASAREALAMNQRNLKTLYDAGVRIGFGTDSGATALRVPGVAEHRELALMVQAGLTPMQAITVATSGAAALLGLEDRGVLAPGTWADLVVLDADPTADITHTTKIRAV